ncbi:MAG: prolipoprotein diacylglyceryl transferase family protein [Myxococcota bacterium]
MYPELFRIPYIDYSISTFGVMMAVAFLTGFWITSKRMPEEGLDPMLASTLLIYVMLGGVLGSKLYFAVDNWLLGAGSFSSLFFARAGITWYGGLVGGTLVGAIGCRIHNLPIKRFADCTAVAGAVGQALGRVGCFLVGDDYGRATNLPWGVSFPQGSPPTEVRPDGSFETVHPTQLYEILWLLPVAALLWSRRRKSPFLFGEYMALNGAGRLVIEHWRENPKVALGLTEPQWIGCGLIVLGLAGWLYYWRRGRGGAA